MYYRSILALLTIMLSLITCQAFGAASLVPAFSTFTTSTGSANAGKLGTNTMKWVGATFSKPGGVPTMTITGGGGGGSSSFGALTGVPADNAALSTALSTKVNEAANNGNPYIRQSDSWVTIPFATNQATARTPQDTDSFGLASSLDGWFHASWSSIKATLKTYFDTFYLDTYAKAVALELAAVPRKIWMVYGDSTDGGTTPDSTTQTSIDALLTAGVPSNNIRWMYESSAGGGTFTVANFTIGTSIENAVLTLRGGTFSIADLTIPTTIENAVLTSAGGGTFSVADLTIGTTIENAVLTLGAAVPSAPTIASVTAGDGSVSVDIGTSAGATSYNLYVVNATANPTWSTPALVITNGIQTTGVTDPQTILGLTNGQTYNFVETAVNASGESLGSAIVAGTPAGVASNISNYSFESSTTGWTLDAGGSAVTPSGFTANSAHVLHVSTYTGAEFGPAQLNTAAMSSTKTQLSDFLSTLSFDWRWNGTGTTTGKLLIQVGAFPATGSTALAYATLDSTLTSGTQNVSAMATKSYSSWQSSMHTALVAAGHTDGQVKRIQFTISIDDNGDPFTVEFWLDEVKL